jgi:hypothetical protein
MANGIEAGYEFGRFNAGFGDLVEYLRAITVIRSRRSVLCAYQYGANTWDGGLANQMWNGRFYEIQMEYNNHAGGWTQIGP